MRRGRRRQGVVDGNVNGDTLLFRPSSLSGCKLAIWDGTCKGGDVAMVHTKKLASIFAVTVIGAALIAASAEARGGGGRGGGGGGHGGMHAGGGSHGASFSRGSIGVARAAAFHSGGVSFARGNVVAHRANFHRHHRVFARSFVGFGTYAGYSCWRWVPTPVGWRQVWACDYPYGSYSYY
jgi:hypothetical protein